MKSENSNNRWRAQAIVAALFAVIGLAVLYWFVTFVEPLERTHQAPFSRGYDEKALMEVLAENGFEKQLSAIDAAGSAPGERQVGRTCGSPGFYRSEKIIRDTFKAAGLEVMTQEFQVVVPVTDFCEILDENGKRIDDIMVYPAMPAGLMPIVLPPEGIKARLVATEGAALKDLAGINPRGSIVLTYLNSAWEWASLANVGAKALLVREDEYARKLRASPDFAETWSSLLSYDEVDFPRLVVRGPIERHVGREITVRCKVTWQSKSVRNIIGVLRTKTPRKEALILNAFYDSSSLIPDLAPGAEQAISVAVMLEYARALAPYRDRLQRDIMFVATAGHAQSMAGVGRLLEAIEPMSSRKLDYRTFEDRRAEEVRMANYADRALKLLGRLEQGIGKNQPVLTRAAWEAEDSEFRRWFEKVFAIVAGDINLSRRENMLETKLRHVRAGSPVFRDGFDMIKATDEERKSSTNSHPLLQHYLGAKKAENESANMMAMPLWTMVGKEEFRAWNYIARTREQILLIAAYHARMMREYDDLIAVKKLFAPYSGTLTINLDLYSGGASKRTDLSVLVGIPMPGTVVEPQVNDVANAILSQVPRTNDETVLKVINWGPRDAAGSIDFPNPNSPVYTELESEPWYLCGRLAFSIVNYDFYPPKACTPEDERDGIKTEVLRTQVPVIGRAILAMGFGRVPFKKIAPDVDRNLCTFHGTVYTAAGTSALVPTHPMTRRSFVHAGRPGGLNVPAISTRGTMLFPILAANPYGEYHRQIVYGLTKWMLVSVKAAVFDEDGRLVYFKDTSAASQGNYKNEKVPPGDLALSGGMSATPMHVSVFRCTTVGIYDHGNPKTLKSFKGVSYLNRMGLAAPIRFNSSQYLRFLDPEFRFYVGLMDGAVDNEDILEFRAFMLNVEPDAAIEPGEPEISGRGYLAADTPLLALPHIDAAASMVRVNEKRLRLQQRYGMADEQMISFHEQARERLGEARQKLKANDTEKASIAADASLAYAINNHPVIRDRISQAVVGILWYLGLLVPFVFFAEKLLFGFTDIRKQLLATAVIFVVVFVLLRLFHPAFQMVRSSMVILLGFVILLLTLLVTIMVGGKFKQNIRDLRGREGRVDGADVNRAGVVGTAFMLGINNMRRRKVRTGLTCITLVLITFVMICFTSVSTDLVNEEYPTGRSAWNGIMIRNPNYLPLDGAEVANLQRLYGGRFPVASWQWLTPDLKGTGTERIGNPEVVVDREFELAGSKLVKRAKLSGCIQMEWNETLFTGLDQCLLTERKWFPRPPKTRAERFAAVQQGYKDKAYVILPDATARELGISIDDVNNGCGNIATNHPRVNIRGSEFEVLGIIDAVELDKRTGLDGKSILPYDVNAAHALGSRRGTLIIPEDIPRLNGSQVMIVNVMPGTKGSEQVIAVATSILFPKEKIRASSSSPEMPAVEYKDQRREVLLYLERLGEPAHYAIDGISYYGSRRRERTFSGLLELLVPIIIAALTVFNTMRGSVYERKDEIYVYNAVGIAPNHVFFIFIAEACVYAVVGAMLGYLLSQGTGRILTALNLTGGMNMDYSSVATIYASLAIMGATLLSTILPARDAARMASPGSHVSWAMPTIKDDAIELNLPFTFTRHDRIAVISYFNRWLDANGAGSSGPFYCSPPQVQILGEESSHLVPEVSSTVWLKPYDLGVSQRIEISLPTDPATGEYIANVRIKRLSGHVESWKRTVKPFVGILRKQFLNWRVTTLDERQVLFGEAKELLSAMPLDDSGRNA